MQSYPFTSQVTYDEQGLPLYDRAVNSEFLRDVFKQYFSDGVFYSGNAACLQVAADTGMQVKVSPGACHIQGAMGIEYYQRTLVVQAAGAQDRIDTVVARLDLSVDARKIDLYVRQGTPGESPSAPALTRDSTTWELGLANLFIAKNTSRISQERITDTRLDTDRCGMVAAAVQPPFDTEEFFAQLNAAIAAHQQTADDQIADINSEWETTLSGINAEWDGWKDTTDEDFAAWFQHIKDQLDEDAAGHLQLQVDEINDTLATGAITTYQHRKIGTEHHLIGKGPNGKTQMTADVDTGDTVVLHDCADVDGLVIEGETTQAGTGDPSPENIRPISGVGMYDQCVVLDGSENWSTRDGILIFEDEGLLEAFSNASQRSSYLKSVGDEVVGNSIELYTYPVFFVRTKEYASDVGRLPALLLNSKFASSVSDLKQKLKSHPLIIWYRSIDYAKSTGPFYTVVELSDDPYRAVGFKLNQPLFDGDSLKVGGKSGFDKMVVLDGNEFSGGNSGAGWSYSTPSYTNYGGKGGIVASNYFGSTNGYISIGASNNVIGINNEGRLILKSTEYGHDYTALNAWIAEMHSAGTPLIVFYKSVDYTEDKDIPVVLEKHTKGLKIVTGTEAITEDANGTTDGYDAVYSVPCLSPVRGSVDLLSSHYKGVAGISPASGNVGVRTASSSDSLIFEDASTLTSLEEAKSYFAVQHTAGTPVQVVYVFSAPVEYARLYDGTTLPAYMGTEDFGAALDGEPVSGKWLTFTQDGTQVNFKGGGLSGSKLAAADAEPGEVLEGVKYFAGDKTLKTGTMPNQPNGNQCPIVTWYEDEFVFLPIPYGAYVTNGEKGYPYIKRRLREIISEAGYENAANYLPGGNQGAKTAALNAGGSYTIPQGWHNGKGKVTANSLASQTSANAENGDIISGKTAWVNGSKRTGTLQDLGHEPKGTGCTLYNGGVYIYFGDSSSRYALSRSVWYPQGDIKNILSFSGSGSSGDRSGNYAEIYRNESNVTREIQARSHASASISGKTVTITVHAEAYQRANDIPSLSGTKSSVDYSFSFTIS